MEADHDVQAILFDFNGTLSNDEEFLEAAYESALAGLGLKPLARGEYDRLLGRSEPEIAGSVLRARTADHRLEEFLGAVSDAYVQHCVSGGSIATVTQELVQRLHRSQVAIGVVTGTLRAMVEPVLRFYGLDHCFPVIVTIEDVPHGKPQPDGFQLAAQLIGSDPANTLVFEDSAVGVAAAQAAGMGVVGVGVETQGCEGLDTHLDYIEDAVAYLENRVSW